MSHDVDLSLTFNLDTGVKNAIFYKSLLLPEIKCDDDSSWSCGLTLVGAKKSYSVKRLKVIKGVKWVNF